MKSWRFENLNIWCFKDIFKINHLLAKMTTINISVDFFFILRTSHIKISVLKRVKKNYTEHNNLAETSAMQSTVCCAIKLERFVLSHSIRGFTILPCFTNWSRLEYGRRGHGPWLLALLETDCPSLEGVAPARIALEQVSWRHCTHVIFEQLDKWNLGWLRMSFVPC